MTIVVLLILAGVSINLIVDNNGIFVKAKNAKLETRIAQIEEEIGLWKQNNFMNEVTGETRESAEELLERLKTRKIITEEEIDREQEIIIIKKSNGEIVKEISYSLVTIKINKTPENEKAGAVLLKVESVEGMTMPNFKITDEQDLEEFAKWYYSLSEETKKEFIKANIAEASNKGNGTNFTTFEEVLQYSKDKGEIAEATEEVFWEYVKNSSGVDELCLVIYEAVFLERCVDENTNSITITGYTITNPNGENSETYVATENGTYIFKVKDEITGKTYYKKVEVTNVDPTLAYEVKEDYHASLLLYSTIEEKYTTFEKAYIIYNGEKIEINENDLLHNGSANYVDLNLHDTLKSLKEEGKIEYDSVIDYHDEYLANTVQTFILVKDGKEYSGSIEMPYWTEF